MPTSMTDEELDKHLPNADQQEEFNSGDPATDDYYTSYLYRAEDTRAFRYVEQSGMDSEFAGANHFGEWLTDDEVPQWTTLPW